LETIEHLFVDNAGYIDHEAFPSARAARHEDPMTHDAAMDHVLERSVRSTRSASKSLTLLISRNNVIDRSRNLTGRVCQREFTRFVDICESNRAIPFSVNTFRYLGTGATDNILRCEKEENITAEAHLIGFTRKGRKKERERERKKFRYSAAKSFRKREKDKEKEGKKERRGKNTRNISEHML